MGSFDSRPDRQTSGLNEIYDKLAATLRRLPVARQRLALETIRMKPDDLRRAIKASGLTHYSLAKQCGFAPDILDRFMSGERDIRFETACKIAKALGLELKRRGRKRKGEK
jgi:ribosome-binding protein aMBF1 (putative translation factor)